MKNTVHYSNITFLALLASTMLWGSSHKDIGVTGVLIVSACWVVSRILREGITSLIHLMTQDDEEKDQ